MILPDVQLSFALARNAIPLRQPVRSLCRISVVCRDLRPLGEEVIAAVIQPVVCVRADHIRCAAVRVVSGVALLAV